MNTFHAIKARRGHTETKPVLHNRLTFKDVMSEITKEHFGHHDYKGLAKCKKPNIEELKAFIQVRYEIKLYKGVNPVYPSLSSVKRQQLLEMCYDVKSSPVQKRQFCKPEQTTQLSQSTDKTSTSVVSVKVPM